jgi:hypothetical protein
VARRWVQLAGLWVLAGAVLVAADFWEEQPFMAWSDKDAAKMLRDSPWADEVSVALPPQLRPESDGGGRGRGGGDGFTQPRRAVMTVSWRSALPIKQALVRGQVGEGGEISAGNQEFLEAEEAFYVVGVLGVPPQFGRTPLEQIKAESFLERKGKDPLAAEDVIFQRGQDTLLLLVAFPRSAGITVDDGDVEFKTKLGTFGIKKKFKLKDMVYQGKLAM